VELQNNFVTFLQSVMIYNLGLQHISNAVQFFPAKEKNTVSSDHVPNYPVGLLLLSPAFPIFKENVLFRMLREMKRSRVMLRNFVADGSNCIMGVVRF
jgi:hypothetical protein